jgi:formylglycine-generating enzyme required for sulfatase activity
MLTMRPVAVAIAFVLGAGAPLAAHAKPCKAPKKYYRGQCRYADEISKLKAAARRKKPATDAVVGPKVEPPKPVPVDLPKPVLVKPVHKKRPEPSGELLSVAGLRWVPLSGGTFQMGYAYGDSDEKPVHAVRLPAFLMSQSEITVAQYRACVDAGYCDATDVDRIDVGRGRERSGECNWAHADRGRHPINCVSWQQAVDFCVWAGGRLPTEAEWEFAARGGRDQMFPWGDSPATCAHAVLNNGREGCGAGSTHAVCSKHQGDAAAGLCDVAGNVWEWVADWYGSTTYEERARQRPAGQGVGAMNPPGPEFGSKRVRRGGSWIDTATFLRASNRFSLEPAYRASAVGFRCAARPR